MPSKSLRIGHFLAAWDLKYQRGYHHLVFVVLDQTPSRGDRRLV